MSVAIGLRRRWASGTSTQIDKTHPLAKGLVTFTLPVGATAKDLASNAIGSPTSTAVDASPYGPAVKASSSTGLVSVTTPAEYLGITTQHSVMVIGRVDSGHADYAAFGGYRYGSSWAAPYFGVGCFRMSQFAGQPNQAAIGWATSGAAYTEVRFASTSVVYGAYSIWVVTVDTATSTTALYRDGVYSDSGTAVVGSKGSAVSLSAVQPLRLLSLDGSGDSLTGGNVAAYGLWNRALTANEAAALAANPYQFLRG